MNTWLKVTSIFLACLGLSAALAAPGSYYLKGAFVGCGMSLGCTDVLLVRLVLSLIPVLSPFAIFMAGAVLAGRVLRATGWRGAQRFGAAAAFALPPPVILLLYLFS